MAAARETSLDNPPEILQLAAHPIRWRLLSQLARSDRTVNELTGIVGEAQNLVSYHLGKLRAAGLVSARRSSADGRDSYYTVDVGRVGELLSTAATTLHPAATASVPRVEGATVAPSSTLFACTGNSARSPMAAALMRERSGGRVDVASAGSRPKPLHPNAVRVMAEEYDIDIGRHRPTHLDELAGRRFDRVVTLCDRVREVCPEFPGHPDHVHWSLADPSAGQPDDDTSYPAFVQLARELDRRVAIVLAMPTGSHEQEWI